MGRVAAGQNDPVATEPTTIAGVQAGRVIEADNVASVGKAVRQAAGDGRAVVDYGRYHQQSGYPPPDGYVQINQPAGVIEHAPADMTVRVRCATPIGELRQVLAEANQWLPIDAPSDMTIGEGIAHHVYGPWRCGFGSVRDLLLGLRFVNAEGDEIAVGGRTVKNVAGYDVTRLMVGSANTLGVLTEAALRTFAVPGQVTRWRAAPLDPQAVEATLTDLLTSDAAPQGCALDWSRNPPAFHVAFAGSSHECGLRSKAFADWVRKTGSQPELVEQQGAVAIDGWRWTAPTVAQLVVPPGRVASLMRAIVSQVEHATALLTHGVVWVGTAAADHDESLVHAVAKLGGHRVWLRGPRGAAPITPTPGDWPMQQRIKHALDPTDLFNPGRLWAGGA